MIPAQQSSPWLKWRDGRPGWGSSIHRLKLISWARSATCVHRKSRKIVSLRHPVALDLEAVSYGEDRNQQVERSCLTLSWWPREFNEIDPGLRHL